MAWRGRRNFKPIYSQILQSEHATSTTSENSKLAWNRIQKNSKLYTKNILPRWMTFPGPTSLLQSLIQGSESRFLFRPEPYQWDFASGHRCSSSPAWARFHMSKARSSLNTGIGQDIGNHIIFFSFFVEIIIWKSINVCVWLPQQLRSLKLQLFSHWGR